MISPAPRSRIQIYLIFVLHFLSDSSSFFVAAFSDPLSSIHPFRAFLSPIFSTMAKSAKYTFLLFFLLSLSVPIALSADPPQTSPAPSPYSGADSPSPASPAPASAHSAHAPVGSPLASSPPAPLPDNSSPGSSPSPAPADGSAVSHTGVVGEEEKADGSTGGISGGKKAGIVVGVIGVAFVVGAAGVVYKKRQQNIRRSQYGYAARREFL